MCQKVNIGVYYYVFRVNKSICALKISISPISIVQKRQKTKWLSVDIIVNHKYPHNSLIIFTRKLILVSTIMFSGSRQLFMHLKFSYLTYL